MSLIRLVAILGHRINDLGHKIEFRIRYWMYEMTINITFRRPNCVKRKISSVILHDVRLDLRIELSPVAVGIRSRLSSLMSTKG